MVTSPLRRECPLTLAAEKGFFELAQLLVSRNANIESRTKKGCTPFFLACREGYTDIAVMLAKHGADTEVRHKWLYCISFHIAKLKCFFSLSLSLPLPPLLSFLSSPSSSLPSPPPSPLLSSLPPSPLFLPQACDHRSQTALLVAFRSGHVELVDWLLGHVAHLPSEQDCQKALLAPSPPATDLTPQRARCLEMISKVCSCP